MKHLSESLSWNCQHTCLGKVLNHFKLPRKKSQSGLKNVLIKTWTFYHSRNIEDIFHCSAALPSHSTTPHHPFSVAILQHKAMSTHQLCSYNSAPAVLPFYHKTKILLQATPFYSTRPQPPPPKQCLLWCQTIFSPKQCYFTVQCYVFPLNRTIFMAQGNISPCSLAIL